jgi:tetratricopeptide (TPR) repeat protein
MKALRVLALATLGLTGFAQGALGQVARVSGTVTDEAGKPIKGATVTATNPEQAPSTFTATTNEKGQFGILGLKRGNWTFVFQALGFETARTTAAVATMRPTPPLEVRLLRGSMPAPPGPLSGKDVADIQKRIDAAEAMVASDPDGAIAMYRELLTRVPALTTVYLRIGAIYEQKPDPKAALEAYRQLEKVDPGNARAQAAIARLTRQP